MNARMSCGLALIALVALHPPAKAQGFGDFIDVFKRDSKELLETLGVPTGKKEQQPDQAAPVAQPAPETVYNRVPERVRQAQELLNSLGYGAGIVDGAYGPSTAKAIRAFQADQGLPQTGNVSASVIYALQDRTGTGTGPITLPSEAVEAATGAAAQSPDFAADFATALGPDYHSLVRLLVAARPDLLEGRRPLAYYARTVPSASFECDAIRASTDIAPDILQRAQTLARTDFGTAVGGPAESIIRLTLTDFRKTYDAGRGGFRFEFSGGGATNFRRQTESNRCQVSSLASNSVPSLPADNIQVTTPYRLDEFWTVSEDAVRPFGYEQFANSQNVTLDMTLEGLFRIQAQQNFKLTGELVAARVVSRSDGRVLYRFPIDAAAQIAANEPIPYRREFGAQLLVRFSEDSISESQWTAWTEQQVASDQSFYGGQSPRVEPVFSIEQVKDRVPGFVSESLMPEFRAHVREVAQDAPTVFRFSHRLPAVEYDLGRQVLHRRGSSSGLPLWRADGPLQIQGSSSNTPAKAPFVTLPNLSGRGVELAQNVVIPEVPLARDRAEAFVRENRSLTMTTVVRITGVRAMARQQSGGTEIVLLASVESLDISDSAGEHILSIDPESLDLKSDRPAQDAPQLTARPAPLVPDRPFATAPPASYLALYPLLLRAQPTLAETDGAAMVHGGLYVPANADQCRQIRKTLENDIRRLEYVDQSRQTLLNELADAQPPPNIFRVSSTDSLGSYQLDRGGFDLVSKDRLSALREDLTIRFSPTQTSCTPDQKILDRQDPVRRIDLPIAGGGAIDLLPMSQEKATSLLDSIGGQERKVRVDTLVQVSAVDGQLRGTVIAARIVDPRDDTVLHQYDPNLFDAQKLALATPEIASAPPAPPLAPAVERLQSAYGPDIVGLRLGMSFAEAEKIIRDSMDVGTVLAGTRGPEEGARDIRPYGSIRIFIARGASEAIALFDEPPAAPGKIVAVARTLTIDDPNLLPEDIAALLSEKYGPVDHTAGASQWAWGATSASAQCRQRIGSAHDLNRLDTVEGFTDPTRTRLISGFFLSGYTPGTKPEFLAQPQCGPVVQARFDGRGLHTAITDHAAYGAAYARTYESLRANITGADAEKASKPKLKL